MKLKLYSTASSNVLHECNSIAGMIAWFSQHYNITIVEGKLRRALSTGNAYYFLQGMYCIANEA